MAYEDWTGSEFIDSGFKDAANNGVITIPKRIRASDVSLTPGQYVSQGDGGGYQEGPNFGLGEGYGHWSGASSINPNYNVTFEGFNPSMGGGSWDGNTFDMMVKSGDKVGSKVRYKRDGDYFVPDMETRSQQQWDTNDAKQNMNIVKMIATGLSMGAMGPALNALGGALQAGTMPTLGQIGAGLNLFNTGSGGQIPYLKEIGSLVGGVSNIGNVATNGINTLSDVAKLVQSGYNGYNTVSKLTSSGEPSMTPPNTTQLGRTTTTGSTSPTGGEPYTGPAQSQPGFDWGNLYNIITGGAGGGGTGLADIWGAWEGSRQAKDQGLKLQQWYSDEVGRRQPYLDKLTASYNDPNSFYDSNQWKGLSSVYKNSVDRGAAKGGTLANPTAREVLLQTHALKSLEDYRRGLTGAAGVVNPNQLANMATRGAELEAGANNPWGAAIGRGGVGGPGTNPGQSGIGRVINDISKAVGGFENLPKQLKDIYNSVFSGDSSNPNHGGTFETDYPTGDNGGYVTDGYSGDGGNYGSDSYGDYTPDWNNPNFDPFSGNADWADAGMGMGWSNPDEWDVEDTSWIDDIGDWFDW